MILLYRLFELPVLPLVLWLVAVVWLVWLRRRNGRVWDEAARVAAVRHLTGGEAAAEMLHAAELDEVKVVASACAPTDYHDPVAKELRLSLRTYEESSLAALVRVAHEVGHAVQAGHRTAPLRLRLRDRLAVVARLAPGTGLLCFAVGLALDLPDLQGVGLLAVPLALALVALGLPLERDASRRGRRLLAMCALVMTPQATLAERALEAASWSEVEGLLPWPAGRPGNRLSPGVAEG
jgi:Zn-dependent membrane protease YugP